MLNRYLVYCFRYSNNMKIIWRLVNMKKSFKVIFGAVILITVLTSVANAALYPTPTPGQCWDSKSNSFVGC